MSNQVSDNNNQAQNNQPLLYPQFEQTTSQIVYTQQRPSSGIVPSTSNYSQQVYMIRPQSADGYKCPIILICPYCQTEGVTITEFRIGNGTLICTIFFFLPLIMNQCKDVYHKCPSCQQIVGHTKYSPCG